MTTKDAASTEVAGASIDEFLGPREWRFFGEGFKRARHRMSAVRITIGADGSGQIESRASVAYPADWSRKGDVDQRPHLSTIDVIVIGAQLGEMYLAHTRRLDREQRRRMAVRRIRVKAGRRPVEDDLSGFPATAHVSGPLARCRNGHDLLTTTVECTVATMRVQLEICHEAGRPDPGPGSYGSPQVLLGDAGSRLFGAGYKVRRQLVENVDVDPTAQTARAVVRVLLDAGATAPDEGLEGEHRASATVIDCFVAGLQLGQVLLYELDGVPRARSNTLWMRRTVLECAAPRPALENPTPVIAFLDDVRLLKNSKAETWRSADIVAELNGISMRCSVVHLLS
ncbi:AvrD family protein [Actinoallomurus purpureus]|uniref:AvrD family protein n=1 Tax=Actinoallomurus purpureus TaxID=478114 RepID=UPI002091E6C9|nr:AvrD family protein [Actinoallomurus purpureus]MCO6004067.1 AvrD family protein [Actinoallomurus purpureus]